MFNIDNITIDKENDGVWTEFKGSKLLVASSGSTKFQRMFAKLQMPHRRAIDKKKVDPEILLDISARAMAKTLLLDWKDVVDNSGSIVKFDSDVAYAAIKNNAELRDFLTEFSTEIENYVEEEKEDLGKSVEASSTGKSSTEAA